jgi:hypothetical protein
MRAFLRTSYPACCSLCATAHAQTTSDAPPKDGVRPKRAGIDRAAHSTCRATSSSATLRTTDHLPGQRRDPLQQLHPHRDQVVCDQTINKLIAAGTCAAEGPDRHSVTRADRIEMTDDFAMLPNCRQPLIGAAVGLSDLDRAREAGAIYATCAHGRRCCAARPCGWRHGLSCNLAFPEQSGHPHGPRDSLEASAGDRAKREAQVGRNILIFSDGTGQAGVLHARRGAQQRLQAVSRHPRLPRQQASTPSCSLRSTTAGSARAPRARRSRSRGFGASTIC